MKPKERAVLRCMEYTMTNPKRLSHLWDSVETIKNRGLKGDLIEAGVYKGGSSMLMAHALKYFELENNLYLFDTFSGMPKPSDRDVKIDKGHTYYDKWEECQMEGYTDWCYGSRVEVEKNMNSVGYKNVFFREGNVLDTVPFGKIEEISLLRLDTDFYDSTRHLLAHFMPLMQEGGIVIFDDYGCWKGAQEAVDEYFDQHKLNKEEIQVVDHSCYFYEVKG